MRINFNIVCFIIILLTPWNLTAQKAEESLVEQFISWETIEGAWGYELIIRQGDQEVIRTQIEKAEYTLSLLPGEYEIQIAVLNKFKKRVSTTDWKALVILEALQPVIRDFTPREYFLKPETDLLLFAQVYQVIKDSQFFLIDEEGRKTAAVIQSLAGESVELHFKTEDLNPGIYQLYVLNPSGLNDTKDSLFLTIHPVIKPEIRAVSLKNIQQQQVYEDIEVRGNNFEKDITASLTRRGQEFTAYEVKWQSEEVITISIITGNYPPGPYSLELINPSGESALKRNAFFMEEAPQMVEIRQTPPLNSFSLLGGYTFALSLEQSHGSSDTIPLGFLLKARHNLENARFWKATGLRPLGVELAVNSSHLNYNNAPFVYSQLFTGFFVYYELDLSKGWSLIPRLGYGVSSLRVSEGGIFGKPIQGDNGISLGAGGSLQKNWPSGLLTEAGIDFRFTSYSGGYFISSYPWFAGGYRF